MLFPRFARENQIVRRAGRTLGATSSANPTIEKNDARHSRRL
jgi:hypothetical protein